MSATRADVAVDEMIAAVLCRAHQTAEALGATDEARTILDIAHLFADELGGADPSFDRMQFIAAATGFGQ